MKSEQPLAATQESEDTRGSFRNATVLSFESRQQVAMDKLISKHQGTPCVSPSMQECPLPTSKTGVSATFAAKLLTGELDTVIVMTGVGFRYLLDQISQQFPRQQVLDFLSDITTIARGPKPVAAMHQAGVTANYKVHHPHTWREILETMDQHGLVNNRHIALLEYGETNKSLIAGLEARGASVMPVTIYRWELPDDLAPLQENINRIVSGQADLAMFTSAQQVVHLFQVAEQMGLRSQLQQSLNQMVIASIGPTTTERLREYELPVHLEPEQGKMAKLVSAAAVYWQQYGTASSKPQLMPQESNKSQHTLERFMISSDRVHGLNLPQARTARAAQTLPEDLSADRQQTQELAETYQKTPWWHSPFLKACRREATSVTPVWLMRQAGRYMKQYQEVRANVSFLELCKNPQLCSEVMLTAVEVLGVDAAIIFSDILPILEPMGFELSFGKGHGPIIHNPVRETADLSRIRELSDIEPLQFVPDTVKFTRRDLPDHIPVIGFSGSPFTLASYCIEGGGSRNYANTKRLMYSDPAAWDQLMAMLTRSIVRYLNAQIRAGAGCVQLFDSWVGCLSPAAYQRFVLPHMQLLLAGLPANVPVINFGTGNPLLLPYYAAAGADVVGVDWRIELDEAWETVGDDFAVQGNLDPMILLGDQSSLRAEVARILGQAAGRPGHIFNLGHGIIPETPVENVIALVDMVHELSDRRNGSL